MFCKSAVLSFGRLPKEEPLSTAAAGFYTPFIIMMINNDKIQHLSSNVEKSKLRVITQRK